MKAQERKPAAKGDRLNWTPLKDVKKVRITTLHIKGKVVPVNNVEGKSSNLLVP